MDIKDLTVEEFIEMKQKMDEAELDTTPYAITDEDEGIQVVGDVSKTETKKHDYTLIMYYPNRPEFREKLEKEGATIEKETPNYLVFCRTYEDVWVPPRIYTAVQEAFTEVYRFFNVVIDGGKIRDLTEKEVAEVLRIMGQDVMERMIHALATILRMPQWEEECVYSIQMPAIVMKLIDDFPEIVNSADFFTERSSEKQTKIPNLSVEK